MLDSNPMNEIWIEKYRPRSLKDVVGQKDIVDRLRSYVEVRNLPHLMFAGPAGTGKTTCAVALARELYGDMWKGNFNELNASDERGIDVVRGKIKEFARTAPLGGAEFKIIFLDEADALTGDAQAALRRTMERYSRTCRFVLSCVTPDTKILLPEDREISIADFMRKFESKEIKTVLGVNEETRSLENDLVLFGMQMDPAANDKRVYELTTMNGRVLKVTEDHPILTRNGWIKAGDISPGMEVVVHPNLEGTPLEEDPRQVVDLEDFKKFISRVELERATNNGAFRGLTTVQKNDIIKRIRELHSLAIQGEGLTVREKEAYDFICSRGKASREEVQTALNLSRIRTSQILRGIEEKGAVERSVDKKTHSFSVIEPHHSIRNTRDIQNAIKRECGIEISYATVERHIRRDNISKGTMDRVINELAQKGLLPLSYADEYIGALARIVAFLMADGHVVRNSRRLIFTGNEGALINVKKDLEALQIGSSEIYSKTIENKKGLRHFTGTTTWFYVDSLPFALLCEYLGAPLGDKVTTPFSIPSWVANGTRFVKREFLRSLLGCEANTPACNDRKNFYAISFIQHKAPELRNEALAFFEQMKDLLAQFDVKSYIKEKSTGYERKKDGKVPIVFSLVLNSSNENMLAFFKHVGYAYEQDKIREAQLAGEYLKHKLFVLEQQKKKASQIMLEIGKYSLREISRRNGCSVDFVIHTNQGKPTHLPRSFMDYSEWVERYDIPETELVLNEIIGKREIECDDVRDLGCLSNHNFIANGIVSHNCNYSSKIIDPIQSRCAVFRFRPLRPEDVRKNLQKIAEIEMLDIDDDALDALVHVSQGDMRKAVNSLQVAASLGEKITVNVVYHTTGMARPEEVRELLETALAGDFIAARNRLDEVMINYGLSGEDIIKQIHQTVFDLNIPDADKVRLIDRTGEVEFRMVEGSNERIQLESLLAYLILVGEHRGDSAD